MNDGAQKELDPAGNQIERDLLRLNILELPHLQKGHQERQR